MSKFQKIKSFLVGIVMIVSALVLMQDEEIGVTIIITILSISLLLSGIRTLIYYITLARFMVGGRLSLYKGVILVDLGLFTVTLTDIPLIYMMLYLLAGYFISGVIDIYGAGEARKLGASSWRIRMGQGIYNMVICLICWRNLHSVRVFVIVYCVGLITSGVIRIVNAFRRMAIIYIP